MKRQSAERSPDLVAPAPTLERILARRVHKKRTNKAFKLYGLTKLRRLSL